MNPFRSLLLMVILGVLAVSSFATTFVVPTDAELVRRAEAIAVVRVESAESRWDHGRLMTAYTLRVDEAIKGDLAAGDAVEVWQLGGLVDDVGFYVPGSADYQVGEKALVFLGKSAYGRWATYGMMLGRFEFTTDAAGNKLLVRDGEQEICGFDEGGAPHQEALRAEKGFLDFVRGMARGEMPKADYTIEPAASKTANSVLQPNALPADYVVKQSNTAGTLPVRWKVFDTNGTVSFSISGTQTGSANSNTSANRAVQAWTNDTNSNVNMNANGAGCALAPCSASHILQAPDGINDILFDAQSADMPLGSESTGIGWGGFWLTGSTHSFASGTWYTITEGEVFIRTGSYSQAFLDQLVTHEVGHTIGFRHSDQGTPASSQAVMNSSISGSYGNTLQSWDMDAVEYVYGPGPCRPTITTQPASVVITSGQTTTLTVAATGTSLTYQWYVGSTGDTSAPVSGATSASYTTPPLTSTTKYWVKVSNTCGTANSTTATVNVQAVCNSIGISGQPKSQTITNGQSATLSVSATGTSPTYQWYIGSRGDTSNSILGATSSTYTTPPLGATTRYWVRVRNSCSSVDSNEALITVVTTCTPPSITTQPANTSATPGTSATLSVTAAGTDLHFQWYEGSASDTTKPIANSDSPTYMTPSLTATAKYWVRIFNSCDTVDSQTVTVTVGTCQAPTIAGQPASTTVGFGESATLSVNASGPAPLAYQWYRGTAPNTSSPVGANAATLNTGGLSATTSFWVKVTSACGSSVNSATATVTAVCRAPLAPVAAIVARTQSNVTYTLYWTQPGGSSNFDVEESRSESFTPIESTASVAGLSKTFTHPNTSAAPVQYFYRVRAVKDCNNSRGAYSATVSITIDPLNPKPPDPFSFDGTLPFPAGPGANYKFQMHIMPPAGKTAFDSSYSVSTTAPFLTVSPSSGSLPPTGATVTVTAAATGLPLGSNTGTVNVTTPGGSSIASVPVSVSLVTPVQPTPKGTPPANALIIPAIAHVDTPTTQFVSDVRLANVASQAINYQLTFTQSGTNGMVGGKQTTFSLPANQTVALNDLVKQWFGEGANSGALEIRPLSTNVPQINFATVATSRTYAKGGGGTFGQFIPAVPFSEFVGKGHTLSIQHIAQSSLYRTNFGIVEGSGQPASVKISVFDTTGKKVDEFALEPALLPGEFRQINKILESRHLALADGRIEVSVTSDTGKVTAYASVLDNRTEDPFLVTPVETAKVSANRFIAAGVADLRSGGLSWRTDMRVYNAGTLAVNATMTFYPDNAPNAPISKPLALKAGEVKVLDNLLATYFGVTSDKKGAVHVTTPSPASLVVTTRTYDQRTTGTYGQFIPAVTVADGIGKGDRPLQLLQLEQSSRYRTNLGVTELSGNKVFGEITAVIPGEAAAAVIPFSLEPNQTQQFSRILTQFLNKDAFNARITIRVTDGNGKIAAYASVVDAKTSDPTYVPAQ